MQGVSVTRREVLPAAPSSASRGRRLVRGVVADAGREDLADVAELVASELITNALLHAATPVEVVASAGPGGFRLEVGDGSDQLPVERDYSALSGTGRGLGLVHHLAESWGVRATPTGKVVWLELVAADDAQLVSDGSVLADSDWFASDTVSTATADADPSTPLHVDVVLEEVPLLLHAAWQEYAEALLRDYVLAQFDFETSGDGRTGGQGVDALTVHARAGEAMALLHTQLPTVELPVVAVDVGHSLDASALEAMYADCLEPAVTLTRALLRVPFATIDSFRALEEVMDAALIMADNGELLAAAPPPELRQLRRWFCSEVDSQARGGTPTPWRTPEQAMGRGVATRGEAHIDRSASALVAADENNCIVAVSRPALELLGYHDPDELVGRRLLCLIPSRFHQAHLAGFTLHLASGRRPLVGRTARIPFVLANGTERLLQMDLSIVTVVDGERLFVATLGD